MPAKRVLKPFIFVAILLQFKSAINHQSFIEYYNL